MREHRLSTKSVVVERPDHHCGDDLVLPHTHTHTDGQLFPHHSITIYSLNFTILVITGVSARVQYFKSDTAIGSRSYCLFSDSAKASVFQLQGLIQNCARKWVCTGGGVRCSDEALGLHDRRGDM